MQQLLKQAAAVTPVRPVRAVSDLNVCQVIREQQPFLEKMSSEVNKGFNVIPSRVITMVQFTYQSGARTLVIDLVVTLSDATLFF